MSIGTFNVAVLNRVVDELRQPTQFLLDVGFREEQREESEEIHFDVDESKPRITPFVHPMRAGKVVDNGGFSTKSFRPAYAKDKRIFDSARPLKRTLGEQIGGSLTEQQRMAINVRRALDDQLEMLTRREAVMASEALRTGKVTVQGDGYPEAIVDFGRDAALTVALTSTARWGESGVKPGDLIEDWSGTVQDKSGAVATTIIMDPKAWKIARADDNFMKLVDTRRGSASSAELGPISRGQSRARMVGTMGDFELWVYQDTYVDEAGATQKMLPDHTVMVLDPVALEGVRAYGAIRDEEAGFQARRFFSKSWLEKDPAVRYLLLQSAPLVVPYRPNAVLAATVR